VNSSRVNSVSRWSSVKAGVAKWQTRQTQNLFYASKCGFESLHRQPFLPLTRFSFHTSHTNSGCGAATYLLKPDVARRAHPRTPTATYRGVVIRLYSRRDGWKATFQLHGSQRRECYGLTQNAAQQAAQTAISSELEPNAVAAGRDEVTARALLADHGVSLTESARFWLAKHAKPLIEVSVEDIREKWLTVRQKNAGYHHAKALRGRSLHFETAFAGRKLSSLSLQDLIEWQDTLEASLVGRTVRNIHDATKMLFKFARKRGYLESDRLSPMEIVDRPKARPSRKEIYTPEQMQELLDAAWALASPATAAMAIAAFTGIRSEELYSVDPDKKEEDQLAWEDFRWKEKFIYVRMEVSKLQVPRNVPIPDRLLKMLQTLKGKGQVYPYTRLDSAYARIARRAGITWKHNALRHSAITYDMLLSSSPTEVANRAGNSVAIIESSYRNRGATKDQAIAWFKLSPKESWGSMVKIATNPDVSG
jgi:hypothetical protein